ncbi:hypothetical protein APHAL10511_005920 [Amanita phalloides]|nr:hypothetical protein APHAL10511_005920 [Amanita phalloides]
MSDKESEYGFVEYSQEDLAECDAITAAYFNPPRVEAEGIVHIHETAPQSRNQVSPVETYRRNRVLSVTDLVSPAWCEVQFDYGLRQKRSRPLEKRPDSFVSVSGKAISVEKNVAAKNDAITKQGQAVHKKLEQELGLKELQVSVTSQEERWALKILNFIMGIEGILSSGYTRELPVFGIIHDQIVAGVIDEVKCFLYHSSNVDVNSSGNDRSQTHIHDYFASQNSLKKKAGKRFTYVLQLLDTKTRWNDSLPSFEDTLPSRLQVMIYYRLLSDLVSESVPFDFPLLWRKLRLNSVQLFSTSFLVGAGLVTGDDQDRTACLDELVLLLRRTVKKLDLVGVDPELQIVYRLRPKRVKKGKPDPELGATGQEDLALALAIEASLRDLQARQDQVQEDISETSQILSDADADSPSISAYATPPDHMHNHSDNAHDKPAHFPNNLENDDAEHFKIVGTREFYYDEGFLNNYMADVLQWWYGTRKPRGVPLHLTRRCFSCEYSTGCEWREEKAREFTEQTKNEQATLSDCS